MQQADILKPKKDITAAFHKYLAVILGERTEAAEDAMFTRKVRSAIRSVPRHKRHWNGGDTVAGGARAVFRPPPLLHIVQYVGINGSGVDKCASFLFSTAIKHNPCCNHV